MVKKKEGKLIRLSSPLLADTLKNYIFYFAAIESSRDSVILFEEPENKVFPPFIFELAKDIYNGGNQFFISTHNPYLFKKLVDESRDKRDIKVFLFEFKDEETKVFDITQKIYEEDYLDPFLNTDYFGKW